MTAPMMMVKCLQDQADHQINLSLLILTLQTAIAANGGAYPPDMSVLVKARKGGADYIYSVLMGYEEPPSGFEVGRWGLLQ